MSKTCPVALKIIELKYNTHNKYMTNNEVNNLICNAVYNTARNTVCNMARNIKKIAIVFVLFAVIAITTVGCVNSNDSISVIKRKGRLIVALSADYPPFEFEILKNGKDQIVGSDVDLAQKIANKIGVDLDVQSMDFDTALLLVASGKANLGISAISATDERKKSFDFSKNYYIPDTVIIIQKSNLKKYKKISDFNGQELAAQRGTIQENILDKQIPNATGIGLAKIPDIISEIKSDYIAGGVIEKDIARSYVSVNKDLAIANIKLKSNKDDGYAVALSKGSGELLKIVNQVITQMQQSGELKKSLVSNFKLAQKAAR